VSLSEPLWGITERDLLSYPKGNIKEDLDLITYMVEQGISEARTAAEDKVVQARLEQARKNNDAGIIDDWASTIKIYTSVISELCNIIYGFLERKKLVNLINQHINIDKYYRNWFNITVDHIIKLHRSLTALRDGKDGDDVLTTVSIAIGLLSEIKGDIKDILLYMISCLNLCEG